MPPPIGSAPLKPIVVPKPVTSLPPVATARPVVVPPLDKFEAKPLTPAQKLEQVEKDLTPTFTVKVDGKDVTTSVPAPFRMNGGNGQPTPEKAQTLMTTAIQKGKAWPKSKADQAALSTAINRNAYGRATPAQLKLVTQKLIEAGALKPYLDDVKTGKGGAALGPDDLKVAIRRMQWDHGVGVDCNGVCQIGANAVNGKPPTEKWGDALIPTGKNGASLNPKFKKIDVQEAKPGDIVVLDDVTGDVGHNVIITDAKTVLADDAKKLNGAPRPTGPLKQMTVLSSWGADGNKDDTSGGLNKQTWVYDQGSKKWGTLNGNKVEWSKQDGPYEHKFVGVYRAK